MASKDIDKTINLPNTNDSSKLVQYLWVDGAELSQDTYIEVTYNSVTITLFVIEEYKYTPVNISDTTLTTT